MELTLLWLISLFSHMYEGSRNEVFKLIINAEAEYLKPLKSKGIFNYFRLTHFGIHSDMRHIALI